MAKKKKTSKSGRALQNQKNAASRKPSNPSGGNTAGRNDGAQVKGIKRNTADEWIRGKIVIRLRSDLCAGSGYSYAGVIDSDVCYDAYGIPYIPARRLRGCLRETLEGSLYGLFPESSDELFGRAGETDTKNLVVGNACIRGYEKIRKQIQDYRSHSEDPSFYDPQEILGRFTRVIGQTALDPDGIAVDNSLRYTRVVNQYSPLDKEPLIFEADVQVRNRKIRSGEKTYPCKYILGRCIKGTRHIGLKRNRGYGNVSCRWEESAAYQRKPKAAESIVSGWIHVRIRNVDPLMLSGEREAVSQSFLPGQNLLGALAKKYLEKPGNTAQDPDFKDLFLNGTALYSNLYPVGEAGVYYPAPVYINRLKKTKKLVNVLSGESAESAAGSDYDPSNGNQPKKLKGKFVAIGEDGDHRTFDVHEVEKEIVYHHSHSKKSAAGEEGLLYGMEVVCAGQWFEGWIRVPERLAPVLMGLLRSGDFYFGKSRSAQYGRCELQAEYMLRKNSPKKVPAGKHLIVTFLSDALLLSEERGEYTVYQDEVTRIVKEKLGIPVIEEEEKKEEKYFSNLETTQVSGYLGIWNLRKPAEPALKAGSCLVYHLAEDFTTDRIFVGERNMEGYGQFRIDCAEDLPYVLEEGSHAKTGGVDTEQEKRETESDNTEKEKPDKGFRILMKDILVEKWLQQSIYDYLAGERNGRVITNAALGRLTLMLRESLDANPENDTAALNDLAERIDSIKSDSVKNEGERMLELVAKRDSDTWSVDFAGRKDRTTDSRYALILQEMHRLGYSDHESRELLNHTWRKYLLTVLAEQKYMGGGK